MGGRWFAQAKKAASYSYFIDQSMLPIATRTQFDVRVGSMHTLEVLLQIRSSDLTWWESNIRDNERQLYKLIGRRILPTELKEEIDADLEREMKRRGIELEVPKKKKGVVIGEVNLKKMAESKSKPNAVNTRKRGNQSASTKGKSKGKKTKHGPTSSIKSTQQSSAAAARKEDATTETKDKRPKILRESGKWIMGKTIQACYIMEEVDRTAMCSLAFRPMKQQDVQHKDTSDDKEGTKSTPQKESDDSINKDEKLVPLATFRSWNKLSKRLNIWVFKFDPNDPTDLSVSEGGGFPRPDLLPLSDIFRQADDDE